MKKNEEDYLKAIYSLSIKDKNEYVKTKHLQDILDFSIQSIIEMIKKLQKKNFLVYKPYKGVRLTKLGRERAVQVTKTHRLWEVFLVEKLGLPWEKVHQEAELLEHVTSRLVLDKLNEYLNYPNHCPHGNFIPNDENNPLDNNMSLSQGHVGQTYQVVRVVDDERLLKFLSSNSIDLFCYVKLLSVDDLNEQLTILVNREKVIIGKKAASMIYVRTTRKD